MVRVFGSFVVNDPLHILDVFGLGLATAIYVDATSSPDGAGSLHHATSRQRQLVDAQMGQGPTAWTGA
jgi:hypothetical protein